MKKRKNFKRGIFVLIIVILILLLWFVYPGYSRRPRVCFDGKCFDVELARTSEERAEGLMFRESLGYGEGMIFIFEEEGKYNFWMKNTLIPLDMLWIGKDLVIVDIKENAQPCSEACEFIAPSEEALYVLEVNSGLVEEFEIEEGDSVRFYGFH